ncbi:hypothetical protein HMI55_001340 [Coelomomyces lativittatus]|nr:hypothetical protein HMI56_004638 [Coelomomyces lativittatus]KAJ1506060.1 hypothetical protein HMI55_001340 [Coelomomyces lativittatus]
MKGPSNTCPLIISGPSGSGKSTLLNRLFKDFPNSFGFSVSHTTRKPRPNETHGIQYFFVDPSTFDSLISQNQFIEHVEYAGNKYGTTFGAVKEVAEKGKICVLDIEMQGVQLVKSRPEMKCHYVFIRPPNLETLESRLKSRATDTSDAIQNRLKAAQIEIKFSETPGVYDRVILNQDIEKAYNELKSFLVDTYKIQEMTTD